ncbi:MAG TPA: FAD:protein FMN transferase [Candidatus Saccharimonadales bacterium]|nr:FAD:protein FMN transferase [Candidatus Saccharimonadales bacterium]
MPITVEIVDIEADQSDLDGVFDYFDSVDQRFSTYKKDSEISRVNRGLTESKWSDEMKEVLELCQQTKNETDGFFDIRHEKQRDPSGLVKGWAIQNAAELLERQGFQNYYVDAGGDIQTKGVNTKDQPWQVGLRNPFNRDEVIKVLAVSGEAVATSGLYIRGPHIYNPHDPKDELAAVASLTVVGPSIFDVDRFATAAYAMGPQGISFIEARPDLEAYSVGQNGLATMTSGFERYVNHA